MRRIVTLAAVLALVGTACSSSTTGGTGGDSATRECPTIAIPAAPAEGTGSGDGSAGSLTLYSGRSEKLVGPLIARFERETNIKMNVRYGDTAEMAAAILEEGKNSPADLFFGQDAGALGALQAKDMLAPLDPALLDKVPAKFRSRAGNWVGVSGRARVLAYDCANLAPADLPDSVFDLTDPKWKGNVGWAPTNGSFQSFVTAMRRVEGEERTREWLEAMKRNDVRVFPKNDVIVEAIAQGEIDLGLVNHYYPFNLRRDTPDLPVAVHFLGEDVGGLVNVAGVGILGSTKKLAQAKRLVEFLLSTGAQEYFRDQTFEYPLAEGVAAFEALPALDTLKVPDIDLSDLADLEGTLDLLQKAGLL